MKYYSTFLVSGALQGAVLRLNGYTLNPASVFSILFASCLLAFALWEYRDKSRSPKAPRSVPAAQLELKSKPARESASSGQLASALLQQ
jgi:hypothetical protein